MANGEFSKWITPNRDQAQSYDPVQEGLYRYSLTFDLSGYAASSAKFSGRFMPEPRSLAIFMTGLAMAGLIIRRRQTGK
jgi:hypothetical protein